MSFWNELPKPIMVLAPMADVTDAPFRRLIAKYSAHARKDGSTGGPDVMWTEFVSADGIIRATPEGKEKLMADLMYTDEERPIVAQLFSSHPEYMEQAARLVMELGFDGIDINMGCPDRSIERQGCGSAMIKSPEVAQEIVRAARRGAPTLPISVKTRIGYNQDTLEEWLSALLEVTPAVITVHARTRKEMSKVPARWERVKRAVEIRDEIQNEEWQKNNPDTHRTLIFGNGDVAGIEDAEERVRETGADGVMLGRAIFGNPWLFHPTKRLPERLALSASSSATHRAEEHVSSTDSLLPRHSSQEYVSKNNESVSAEASSLVHRTGEYDSLHDSLLSRSPSHANVSEKNAIELITVEERLRVMVEHTKLFEELLPFKNFAIMKKHYKAYVNGFDGAKELRTELMEQPSSIEIERVVNEFLRR